LNAGRKYDCGNAYWDAVADTVGYYYLIPKLAEYKSREYIDLLERWEVVADKTILITDLYEAAFGNTGINLHLSGPAKEVWGMDISVKFCLRAQENFKNHNIGSRILTGDATRMPLANDTMDVIISPSTFDHFPQIDQALKECHRILKPGGKLVLALNSADNPFFRLGVRLAERFKRHEYQTDHFYSVKKATALLGQAGFAAGRSTAIMHIPIGLTTLIELFDRIDNPVAGRINDRMIGACRRWGRLDTRMKSFTGWWIVLEGIKR
jgi:SAM-dependent methyltransferase